MIINHLTMVISQFESHKENFLLTEDFDRYIDTVIANRESHNFAISLAYEIKDYGLSIVENEITNKIKFIFEKLEKDILENKSIYTKDNVVLFFIAKSIYFKYFVFTNKSDYLKFYKENTSIGTESLLKIFNTSFIYLYNSIRVLNAIYPEIKNCSNSLIYNLYNKELSESYSLFEKLGDKDSSPNIDSSYVFIDQIENLDFFILASKNLFNWTLKNAGT